MLFPCRGGGNPLGQSLADLFRRHSSARISILDPLIDGRKRFLVLIVKGGSGFVKLEFELFDLSHMLILALIRVRCKEMHRTIPRVPRPAQSRYRPKASYLACHHRLGFLRRRFLK